MFHFATTVAVELVGYLIIALCYENTLAVQEKENVYCVQRKYFKETKTLHLKK